MSRRTDKKFMRRAIALATAAEEAGNIPVGAVIVLDAEVVAEGQSTVLRPEYHPGRHAEVEALRRVDTGLWPRAREMTCYSTLEPCVMCAGALLLHGVGRVVFGADDTLGGASSILEHLPAYYDEGGVFDWIGPLMPRECDLLYRRADELFESLPVGRASWMPEPTPLSEHLALLEEWVAAEGVSGVRAAQKAAAAFADEVDDDELEPVLPYAQAIFRETGYLKDYRRLKRYAKRAGRLDALDAVDDVVRDNLPDVWIGRMLDRGHYDTAIDYWFEVEDHRRARHAADRLVELCGDGRPDLVASCRLSLVNYLIGRRKRRHYRRACAVLRKLRDELRERGHLEYWPLILEDIRTRHSGLRALQDELDSAGF